MGYRRALSFSWETRDTLAVLVIALTVSFLVGAAILGVSLGQQTTTISDEFGTSYHVERAASPSNVAGASDSEVRLVLVRASVDGTPATIVGIPPDAPDLTVRGQTIDFPRPATGTLAVVGGPPSGETATLETDDTATTVTVAGRSGHQVLRDSWYVTRAETVSAFEATEVVTIERADGEPATPLLSALQFFVRGTDQLVRLLQLATLASGILVGVTTYSVIRLTVKERRPDIAVLRSTGATPRQIVGVYTLRAITLAAIGLALGYSIGVILVRAVLNAAVYAGLPTSLALALTPTVVQLLGLAAAVLLVAGVVAGLTASYPEATKPLDRLSSPGQPTVEGSRSPFKRLFETRLLGWEATVPTVATLSVFMGVVLLLSAVIGAVGPLSGVGQQTITEPDAPHPIASNVPESYASALRSQGVAVSPEILLFEVYRSTPFVARGVNYSAYESLAHTTLTAGREPTGDDEALVGASLAEATDLAVGDTLVLGGSTTPGITRIEIVGRFAGTGVQDDQLLVSLDTARHLTTTGDNGVQFIRTSGLASGDANTSTIVVTDATVTRRDGSFGVAVEATNLGLSDASRPVSVTLGDATAEAALSVPSRRSTTTFVAFETPPAGTVSLSVADVTKSVTVDERGRVVEPLRVTVPASIPVGSEPRVSVSRGSEPVANATVSVDDRSQTQTTDASGATRVRFNETGTSVVSVRADGQQRNTTLTVSDDATRRPVQTLSLSPQAPTLFTSPTVTARLSNPWAQRLNATVTIRGPGTNVERAVSLAPGGNRRVSATLPQRPAGEYTISSQVGAGEETTLTYRVRGDERLATALAGSGRYTSGGGIAQAIQLVFGNLEVLLAAVVALVSLMTVGSTTAAFTRSTYGVRKTIGVYRVTGARRTDVLRLVLFDTLKVGLVASVAAFAIATAAVTALLSLGELRVFGVALTPVFSPGVVAGMVLAGLGLAVTSACLATGYLLLQDPAALLVDRHIPTPEGEGSITNE
ncbi:peptide ABC transporter permease [Haloferax sp. Atlit-12N]|uniref:FtsX-like permease family protein n=1 Tax=Haloferax sp. Atlit-12N TaxID=2077203 RepID=UPI000E25C139|nr:FtsX-like permease family protein [Haloferax sp. Atlit-12N]RDZ63825.1 peptide ABC transporter permease [Haloferax sp. Atlit-12N]